MKTAREDKRVRAAGAREALGKAFGKSRVRAHCGSYDGIEDTRHYLYILIRLRKDDTRDLWDERVYKEFRAQVIRILQGANVELNHTDFCRSQEDPFAVSLSVVLPNGELR